MNKILAIETSGKVCSVALVENNLPIAEYNVYYGNKHDKFCAEFVRRILDDNLIELKDLSAVAVSVGPGSFTGLRIGTAIAKALTIDNKPPLIAVPTLSAMAYELSKQLKQFRIEKDILSIIHSHAKLFYAQKFNSEGKEISEIEFLEWDSLKDYILSEKFALATGETLEIENKNIFQNSLINASMIGKLAFDFYQKQDFINPEELIPMYVQEFIPKNNK